MAVDANETTTWNQWGHSDASWANDSASRSKTDLVEAEELTVETDEADGGASLDDVDATWSEQEATWASLDQVALVDDAIEANESSRSDWGNNAGTKTESWAGSNELTAWSTDNDATVHEASAGGWGVVGVSWAVQAIDAWAETVSAISIVAERTISVVRSVVTVVSVVVVSVVSVVSVMSVVSMSVALAIAVAAIATVAISAIAISAILGSVIDVFDERSGRRSVVYRLRNGDGNDLLNDFLTGLRCGGRGGRRATAETNCDNLRANWARVISMRRGSGGFHLHLQFIIDVSSLSSGSENAGHNCGLEHFCCFYYSQIFFALQFIFII